MISIRRRILINTVVKILLLVEFSKRCDKLKNYIPLYFLMELTANFSKSLFMSYS